MVKVQICWKSYPKQYEKELQMIVTINIWMFLYRMEIEEINYLYLQFDLYHM